MRIFVFNPSYPPVPCGVGDYTRGLAVALVGAGHDVTVITAAGATARTNGPPRVLPLLGNWDITSWLRGWRYFARPRPDLVVSSFPAVVTTSRSRLLYLVPGLAKAFLGRPRIVFILHEFLRVGETERNRLRLALRWADRIVTVTEAERDAIVARYPLIASRVVVRHNPSIIPIVNEDPSADARMRASFAPPERPVISFFGFVWSEAKGFEDLLGAITRTDALLLVTGSLDPDNSYHAHLAREIERLGLVERVRWLGFLSDEQAGRMLRAVDAVVLPYRGGAESSYTSLLAALVNGAAVITTGGPRIPSWFQDGETALLVDSEDPAGLASAIERLVADKALASRLRAGARAVSVGWDEIVKALIDLG